MEADTPVDGLISIFDGDIFDYNIFDTDGVGPPITLPVPPRGIPLNAYKAFKTLREFRGEPRFPPPSNLAEE